MRKFLITLTVVALILSIVGTGIIVYIESNHTTDTSVE